MLILVTYDVNVQTVEGRRRLRRVAKTCNNFGTRVQNSVFECVVDNVQYQDLKNQLSCIVDHNLDSLRYYNLGKSGRRKVLHEGAKPALDVEDIMIL